MERLYRQFESLILPQLVIPFLQTDRSWSNKAEWVLSHTHIWATIRAHASIPMTTGNLNLSNDVNTGIDHHNWWH